jgi:hypothetical protein
MAAAAAGAKQISSSSGRSSSCLFYWLSGSAVSAIVSWCVSATTTSALGGVYNLLVDMSTLTSMPY